MAEAVAITESMVPPSGPPGESATDSPVKPAHELYGELLLAQGRDEEALALFQKSLLQTPMRGRSLLGQARAAERLGKTELARKSYETIAQVAGAGADLPGLEEARGYVSASEND
jgi:tetratricopeptide (TPR) repeat protein